MNHSFMNANPAIGQDSIQVSGLPFPYWILEDKGFKQDRPRAFRAIAARLKEPRGAREMRIRGLSDLLSHTCKKAGLIDRTSHTYSFTDKIDDEQEFDDIRLENPLLVYSNEVSPIKEVRETVEEVIIQRYVEEAVRKPRLFENESDCLG